MSWHFTHDYNMYSSLYTAEGLAFKNFRKIFVKSILLIGTWMHKSNLATCRFIYLREFRDIRTYFLSIIRFKLYFYEADILWLSVFILPPTLHYPYKLHTKLSFRLWDNTRTCHCWVIYFVHIWLKLLPVLCFVFV